MNHNGRTLITLGILFLLGLLTDAVGRRTRLPRVTLLLVLGVIIGPSGMNFLTPEEGPWYDVVTNMALVMIGFLLGEKFTLPFLRRHGRYVLWLSASEVVSTALIVLIGLLVLGVQPDVALLLAGISPATDPAASTDVVRETKADGVFTRTLMGVVAVDDAWGLIVFSLMLATVHILGGEGHSLEPLLSGAWELGGAILIGLALGISMSFLTGRIQPGEPTLVEALGLVFLCGGIAMWLKVSFLLASMVMGCVVANLARHHTRPFHAIENVEWPFMILFFLLAGASLQVDMLYRVGFIGSVYIGTRIIGRFVGAWVGGALGRTDSLLKRWMGLALMPQAGVALGMALVAVQRRPELGEIILPVVIASTILFEVIGPILTRTGLKRAGEIPASRKGD